MLDILIFTERKLIMLKKLKYTSTNLWYVAGIGNGLSDTTENTIITNGIKASSIGDVLPINGKNTV